MGPFEVLCGIAAIILALYYYFISPFDFFKSRGIRNPQPIPVFGNVKDVTLAKQSMTDFLAELYNEYKDERIVGFFSRRTPVFLLRDLDLIKDVIIKDFSKFANRGLNSSEKADPLSQHLFILEHRRWRPLRMKLSPVFTSGKLKEMFPLILECAEHLEKYLEKLASKNEPVDCREVMAKYSTDVIGSCAFGIDTNALADEDSEFRKMGKAVFATNFLNLLRARLRQATPWLYTLLGYILPPTKVTTFFTRLIVDNIDYRQRNNIVRHDFVDTLLELKKNADKFDFELTDSIVASQAFVFFVAGFETSSTAMSHALYELAQHHKIQDQLREEINNAYAENDGKMTYDTVKKMEYLDKVFKETLRKYPPATFLMRQATADYTFEGTNVTVPKNIRVWIPNYAIQRDPKFYPNPDVFDPERFSEEVVKTRHPMAYLPFGDGPRNCIGARFAIYQSKLGLIKAVRNFKIDICEKTHIPYETDPKSFLLAAKNGVHLKITKINRA